VDIIDILLNAVGDPISYSLIFFIYVVLAAVVLPIPVEIGLFNPNISSVWLLLVLSIGKGAGALIVFEIGSHARGWLKRLSSGGPLSKKIVTASERFVIKYGYYGLFIIMSVPLMLDSVTLYLFSLLNPEENKQTALEKKRFILINMAAGVVRGFIILAVAHYAGVRLV
jgi:hypothetical protein